MMFFVTSRQLSQLFMNFKKIWINPGKVNFPQQTGTCFKSTIEITGRDVNMFKANNKDTRTTSKMSSLLILNKYCTPFSKVSITDFELVMVAGFHQAKTNATQINWQVSLFLEHWTLMSPYSADNYMFKINIVNPRTICNICSILEIITPERPH